MHYYAKGQQSTRNSMDNREIEQHKQESTGASNRTNIVSNIHQEIQHKIMEKTKKRNNWHNAEHTNQSKSILREEGINKADKYKDHNINNKNQEKGTKQMTKRQEKQQKKSKEQSMKDRQKEHIDNESESEPESSQKDSQEGQQQNNTKEADGRKEHKVDTFGIEYSEEEDSNYDSATASDDNESDQYQSDNDSDEIVETTSEGPISHSQNDDISKALGDIAEKINLSPRGGASTKGGRTSSRGRGSKTNSENQNKPNKSKDTTTPKAK
ncbi:uncharacterized protein LOC129903562 [Solanum dulcamara]|uniref:uncharacterized protein LOC129903562 n=1 Tax=Solanum dulcamara TaxID=45834 RepID=UPI002485BEB7|nr:uncharacterized protein LOC129903562 [Solanum dulcamara]